ncbi:MAG TPA: mismatch-specific DNA-glycosylase [Trueperaceae bacterium]
MSEPERATDPPVLADVLGPGLRVLWVGFNPSPRSAEVGHHYAGRGNHFWRLLAAAGLTPRLLAPSEDQLLPQWGLGLTNLVARPTRAAADLDRRELRAGVPRLRALAAAQLPQVVAYTGKGVYLAAAGVSRAPWGLQPESLFDGVRDFVLPSPSGLVRMSFEQKLEHYRALRSWLRQVA